MDSKERIDQLTDQLKEAGYRYYVLDDPTMEDYEYDRLYRELEEAGIVENFDQYKADLIVERNANDRNRVDVLAPPDLVNQFRIFAMKTMYVL